MAELFDTKKYAEEWLNEYTNNIFDEGYVKGIDEAMELVKRFVRINEASHEGHFDVGNILLSSNYDELVETTEALESIGFRKPVYVIQLPDDAIEDLKQRISQLGNGSCGDWTPTWAWNDDLKNEKISTIVPIIEEAERDKFDCSLNWVQDGVTYDRVFNEFCEMQYERRKEYGYDY